MPVSEFVAIATHIFEKAAAISKRLDDVSLAQIESALVQAKLVGLARQGLVIAQKENYGAEIVNNLRGAVRAILLGVQAVGNAKEGDDHAVSQAMASIVKGAIIFRRVAQTGTLERDE